VDSAGQECGIWELGPEGTKPGSNLSGNGAGPEKRGGQILRGGTYRG
jgi:hypothetical protein